VRLDPTQIREILARTDIGTLIGGYVQLTKRGRDLVGLCPFHGEKTPSFHVHPDRGFFKCFGCGQGGDAIKFVQLLENVPFPEAARTLAKRVGIELEPETPAAARVRSEKEQIYAANELAASYFHRLLRLAPEAEAARSYCAERGLSSATIESFKLGFAPPQWDGLVRELSANGVDLPLAAKAGLVKQGQHGYYDFYRARLMIPTYATTGEVVAFGGRALDASEPKYLNTSTTPVYTKGRGLFALERARRAVGEWDALIVVEGYLDCIALHQAGFANAVASLGTAFTPEQATQLRKVAERIFLCFDADAAGGAATDKSIDVLIAAGCLPYVVELPAGEDPDSFVRSHGPPAFQKLLDGAVLFVQFKLDREIAALRAKNLPPAQAARDAELRVRALPREEWDRWRVYVANALGLAPDDLRKSRFVANPANFAPRDASGARFVRHAAHAAQPLGLERDVLMTLLDEPALVAEYAGKIPQEMFKDARYGRIYETLVGRQGELIATSDVFASFGDDREAVDTLIALQQADRSSKVRFQDSAERRAHLDRIVEVLNESGLDQRLKEFEITIDARLASGEAIPEAERAEYRKLVEERDRRRAKRLGTHS
jgi:DNA primase catalytic core